MLQLQQLDAVVRAHQPRKTGDPADPRRLDERQLGGRIDRLGRDADVDHPPVTGGNSATSRAPPIGASSGAKVPSTAARSRAGSAKASA